MTTTIKVTSHNYPAIVRALDRHGEQTERAPDGNYHGIRNGISITNISTYTTPFSTLNVASSSPIPCGATRSAARWISRTIA